MTKESHRILVVDDHPLFRKGVSQLLALEPSFEIVGEAGTFEDAISLARWKDPDLVLLDMNMKGTSGVEILSAIKEFDPSIRVIMLTVSDAPSDLIAAIRSGADGYLLKDLEPEEILEQVKLGLEGKTVLAPTLSNALAEALREEASQEKRDLKALTDRESAVLQCIAAGMSNKVIAKNLDISDGTVKVHVKHVLRKLNFRSRVEAAVWMAEQERKNA